MQITALGDESRAPEAAAGETVYRVHGVVWPCALGPGRGEMGMI